MQEQMSNEQYDRYFNNFSQIHYMSMVEIIESAVRRQMGESLAANSIVWTMKEALSDLAIAKYMDAKKEVSRIKRQVVNRQAWRLLDHDEREAVRVMFECAYNVPFGTRRLVAPTIKASDIPF